MRVAIKRLKSLAQLKIIPYHKKISGVENIMMMTYKNINGYWIVSDMVDGYVIKRTYIYYTKREAIKLFKKFIKGIKK